MSMAHSIENRSPLVDHEVVEYAASIPASYKLHRNQLKYILRRVAARYLPHELVHRKKQGFGFPIAIWMRTELAEFLRRLFRESRFVELGIFERSYIDTLLEEHLSGKVDHNFRLWILLNLELWYRIYFESQSLDAMRDYTDQLMAA
jgi:asparagine synthase (glutamine-hydrolysing)